MSTLLIRDLKDSVKETLRLEAEKHGRSVEAEARLILEQAAFRSNPRQHPYEVARRLVAEFGPMELDIPPRDMPREPPDFS